MKRLALFPDTTRIVGNALTIGGLDVASLAEQYGTPLYVYDRATLDSSLVEYQQALKAWYPGEAHLTYAGKAFFCRAIAEWIQQQGIWADCTGQTEIETARAGEVAREHIVVHGVNKSAEDIRCAQEDAGTIVIDNLTELNSIAAMRQRDPGGFAQPDLWFRLLPGIAVSTHHSHTQTGQHGSKFGMTSEELSEAAQTCQRLKLHWNGIHFHQGSNFRDPAPLVSAIELALDLAKKLDVQQAWHFCPGGGWSVAYHEDELPQPNIETYVRLIAQTMLEKCKATSLPLPVLHLEPGRSLIARAGVAVYKIGVAKRRSDRTWLLVDGGMADNPRHALYGSRYSCLPARGLDRPMTETVSIAGPFCESGDVLIDEIELPRLDEGELIAIPASGAYQLSMSSNYNGARRPAVVWLDGGGSRPIVRRETIEDLSQRDVSLA